MAAPDLASLCDDLEAEHTALDAVVAPIAAGDWDLPTPAQGTGQMTALLQRLSSTDTTGILGQLMQAAQARNA